MYKKVIGKHYMITPTLLGEGSFGKVFMGEDLRTGKKVAIKREDKSNDIHLLRTESNIINYVNQQRDQQPVLQNYWFGADRSYYYLVTDLLGLTLENLLKKSDGKFTLKTVLMLSEQMINRLRFYHDRNIIHRDIKPDNFLIQHDLPQKDLYLIDFGLAKKYRKNSNKEHISYTENKMAIGTPRFMSVNVHEKKEQSRRDDMYSLGYVIVYLLMGRLPWQGIAAKNKKERYRKIYKIKKNTLNSELLQDYHCPDCEAQNRECYIKKCVTNYFDYLDTVKFKGDINYNFLIHEFLVCMEKHCYAYDYQWDWSLN